MRWRPEDSLQATCVHFVRMMCIDAKPVASLNGMYLGPKKPKVHKLPAGNRYLFAQIDIPKKQPSDAGIAAYIAKMKLMGMVVGDPDLRIYWSARGMSQIGMIELKDKGKKPTPEQVAEIAWYKTHGYHADWCDNFDDFVKLLIAWEVPMRKGSYAGPTGIIGIG